MNESILRLSLDLFKSDEFRHNIYLQNICFEKTKDHDLEVMDSHIEYSFVYDNLVYTCFCSKIEYVVHELTVSDMNEELTIVFCHEPEDTYTVDFRTYNDDDGLEDFSYDFFKQNMNNYLSQFVIRHIDYIETINNNQTYKQ